MSNIPAHQRLSEMSVKHLQKMLSRLCVVTGRESKDWNRDDRTNTKDKLCSFIRAEFTADQIDAAHQHCVDEYKANNPDRSNRRRFRPRSEQPAPSVEPVAPVAPIQPVPASPWLDPTTWVSAHEEKDPRASFEIEATASAPVAPVAPTVDPSNPVAGQLAALLASLAQSSINEDKVRAIVEAKIAGIMATVQQQIQTAVQSVSNNVLAIEVKAPELPPVDVGIQHRNFPKLLRACNARLRDGSRLNIWLAGPAGSGKTSSARAVATALSLPFYTTGAIDQAYKLIGFVDANGRYLRTGFREAWENGGVFLFDEVDASGPGAVLALNTALSSGIMDFPDSTAPIARHPDCIIIAGANTFGTGGTGDYNGRMKQDTAFLNRFVMLDWPTDEALERAICGNLSWVSRVQEVRGRVASKGLRNVVVSTRATVYGEALLAAGLDRKDVEAMTLRQGMKDADWQQIAA